MCAKVVPSFTDENQDLRKQIGCMNGIFQLFDRHHFPTRRRISSQNLKRLFPGAHHNMDPRHATETANEKDLEEAQKESIVSFESSRASCSSSSCSSMLSSSDYNKMAQPEAYTFIPKKIRETSHQTTAMREQNTSFAMGQQSLDLRDVVKDSMYRETHGLSIKSKAKDERRGSVLKHIDSPRPSQQFKSGQSRVAVSDGSIQDLGKLQEVTEKYKDERPALPRFSYDGRESRDTLNSTIQRKELPRLSLDSRASTVKSSAFQSRSNFLLRDLHIGNENSSQVLPSNQEPGSNKRSSNVVAKLMGLEAFSDVISTDESRVIKIKSCADIDSVSRSPKPAGMGKHTQDSCSPRVLQKDPASPHLSNANSVMKLTSRSRFPPEPAPWRQPDTSQGSQKQALKSRKSSAMTPNMSSVYGEIEKRITELEFPKSRKDLIALKHMLEAMEKTRQRLENRKGNLAESASQTSRYSVENILSDPDFRLSTQQDQLRNHQVPTMKGTIPRKTSIMIMKPAKVFDKIKISSSSVPAPVTSHLQKLRTRDSTYNRESSVHKHPGKDFTSRNNLKDPSWHIRYTDKNINWRTSEVQQTSNAPQCIKIESRATCGRSFGMASPRLKQKKQGIYRQSHPTTPPSDSGMIKKKCSKQVVASGHLNRKLHLKSTNLQNGYDQLSEHSGDTRYSSHQSDTASVMSESNISLVSHMETEVVSLAQSIEMNAKQNQEPIHRNSAARLREDTITDELATTILEQPSPVSVLDAAFCRDDSPSPVKKISTAFRDDENPNFDEEWHVENLNGLPDHKRFYGHSRRKLDMIEDLVHKLRFLNSAPYEDTLHDNTFMYESPNPDLQYITKMLQASGLLRDVIPVPTINQHHSSYHLINPDLFDVLEQTEQNMKLESKELDDENARFNQKIHRKIVFDTVNEILVHKFASQGLFTLGRKMMNQDELRKEIHLELNRLQKKQYCSQDDKDDGFVKILKEDMMHQSADWAEYTCEIPVLALDIERLIFKDLINEIVMGEAIRPA